MISPEHHVRVDNLTVPLARSSPPLQTGGLEVVLSQHLNAPSDGQVVQLVGHFQLEEVIDGQKVEHPAVYSGLEEGVLILGEANVIQPSCDPLVVQLGNRINPFNEFHFFQGRENVYI